MQRYNITDLMRRTGRRSASVLLPPISERLSMQREYLAVMRRLLKELRGEIEADVLPRYAQIVIRDADAESFDRVKRIAEYLVGVASRTVNRILSLESMRHTEKFMTIAQQQLGIDIRAVVKQEDLESYLQLAARRNADLIKSQTETMIRRIEQATLQNAIAGNSPTTLRKKLIEEFGIADGKAKLLARDQSAKLTSDLNRIRQEQAGIERYKWATVHDERVRPLHKGLDGKEYQWGKPTGAESGLPPGQPIQCRCIARGIVVFGVEDKPKPATPAVETKRLDEETKRYVLDEGKAKGVEFMWSYDRTTGQHLGKNSGTRGFVGFTQEFTDAVADPKRQIVLHHNHPSSNSFSPQDILELNRRPGLASIWAHGHNGSSYYAEKGKYSAEARVNAEMNRTHSQVRSFLQSHVNNRTISVEDAMKLEWHTTSLAAEKRGIISNYRADLHLGNKKAFETHQDRISRFLNEELEP